MTCAIIKTEQTQAFIEAECKIDGGLSVPVMNQYYMQLTAIDGEMARDFYPINQAIHKALEKVLHYYAYRPAEERHRVFSVCVYQEVAGQVDS